MNFSRTPEYRFKHNLCFDCGAKTWQYKQLTMENRDIIQTQTCLNCDRIEERTDIRAIKLWERLLQTTP